MNESLEYVSINALLRWHRSQGFQFRVWCYTSKGKMPNSEKSENIESNEKKYGRGKSRKVTCLQ
jgi:hypothetical protein